LTVEAIANAHAANKFGSTADAIGGVLIGVGQAAIGATVDTNVLTNAGTISVLTSASALAPQRALAEGIVGFGIAQLAIGDGATNGSSTDVLTNLGQINIGATVGHMLSPWILTAGRTADSTRGPACITFHSPTGDSIFPKRKVKLSLR
jgi:hypothetical protein